VIDAVFVRHELACGQVDHPGFIVPHP
jgi:hypothetical protein